MSACVITSPSEWTRQTARRLERDAAEHERHAVRERVRVDADTDAVAHAKRLLPRLRRSNT
jgi:hypothetical protein